MIIRIDYPQPAVRLDLWGGVSGRFEGLDRFNRITDQRWQNNTGTTPADIDRYQYGYDRDSNRQYKANVVGTPAVAGGLDEYYAYDRVNRLNEMHRGTLNGTRTGIGGTPSREMDWTLDPTGNWPGYLTRTAGTTDLNQARTSNKVNEITAITETTGPTWVTPAYDAAGNTTTMPQVATPTSSFTATYDAWNRMTGISASGTQVAKYQYDGRNRRVVKLTYTGGTLSETRHFYFTDGWQDIEERVGTSTSMDKQYVWGVRYVDELVCRDDAVPERLYACQDANFNVTSITDTGGAVQERFVYDPYGTGEVQTGAWTATPDVYGWTCRFQGQQYDLEMQIYLFRARYYHSGIGTFVSRDPLNYADGTNLCQYLGGNPITFVDPFGFISSTTQPTTHPTTQPTPVDPGSKVDLNLSAQAGLADIIGAMVDTANGKVADLRNWGTGRCVEIDVNGLKNPKGSITCQGAPCGIINATIKKLTGCDPKDNNCIGQFLSAQAAAGGHISVKCPGKKTCCNVMSYKGTYPLNFSLTVNIVALVKIATITASLTGDIDWNGTIGDCQ